jgi:hypothetical protein
MRYLSPSGAAVGLARAAYDTTTRAEDFVDRGDHAARLIARGIVTPADMSDVAALSSPCRAGQTRTGKALPGPGGPFASHEDRQVTAAAAAQR